MTRIYDSELAEVNAFLDSNSKGSKYIQFQASILAKLREMAEQPELAGRICEVKSRAETSPAEPIKSRKKIALKLRKWRKSGERVKISDIHDIAGVTVVCPYPSDVGFFKDYLIRSIKKHSNELIIAEEREINRSDYHAFHIEIHGQGQFLTLKCELQLKTVFTQSWGVKVHDLMYKPPGDIDKRLQANMDKLGHILKLVDDQSEILKSIIEEAWFMDRKRRDVAQKFLLFGVAKGIENDDALKEILSIWENNESEISTAPVNSELIVGLDKAISSYADKHDKLSQDFCRVVCLYALSRSNRDRNDFALAYVDDWIASMKEGSDPHKKALVFLCNALMSMGEYEECLATGRKVIALAELERNVNPHPLLVSRLNYAYYLSEAFYHRAFDESTGAGHRERDETDACAKEAIEIVNECRDDIVGSKFQDQLSDTIGAVLITCGSTEKDIRGGLELCRKVLERSVGTDGHELIALFFALHERRAYKRLVELE